MKTPLRTAIAVVLASAALLGCADRSKDDEGDDVGDVGGSESTGGEPTPMPDLGEQLPDPDDRCAHPANTGSAVWLCSDPLPEPHQDEARCQWDPEGMAWSCFFHPCAQNTELGAEMGFDPDVWVCEFVFVRTCSFDQFGEDPFDCPTECEVEGDFMTCPDFDCELSDNDVWVCY